MKRKESTINRKTIIFITISIILISTILTYGGLKDHQFLGFDDPLYVTDNIHVKSGLSIDNIKWAFSFNKIVYWHPLTWLSHMMDVEIFGVKPVPHLYINLLLHILNSIILFIIIFRLTSAPIKAAFIGLLFAIHPLNIEAVAWIAERKTVLSAFFFFSAIYAYLFFIENKAKWKYALIILIYMLGLMCKPSIIIFPLILLLLDYWPIKRFSVINYQGTSAKFALLERLNSFIFLNERIFLEKIPFIILSLISAIITILSLSYNQFIIKQQVVSIFIRIYNYFVSIILYLKNIAWPVELSIYHPFPQKIIISYFLLSLIIVFLISILVTMLRKSRPWLFIGWLWFMIALLPASGIIQAGLWPAIANRFMYLPIIGIFIMIIWETDSRLKGNYSAFLKAVLFLVLILYFAFLSRVQLIYYSNNYAVFKRSVEVAGESEAALNNIGNSLLSLGKIDEAMGYFYKSIEANPVYYLSYYNYGVCLLIKNDFDEAAVYFQRAAQLNPKHAESYINLSFIKRREGNNDEALLLLKKALEIDKNNIKVRYAYGDYLSEQGNYEEAISHYLFILKINPNDTFTRLNLANAYQNIGLYKQAIYEYDILQSMAKHDKGKIYYGKASVYSQLQQYKECKGQLQVALKEGFNIYDHLATDERFKNFRTTSYYKELLKEKNKMKDQKKR